MIVKPQLHWTGHVFRTDSTRLLRQILYGELSNGHRKIGHPKRRFKDRIKDMPKQIGIPARELEDRAQDRILWCQIAKEASTKCDAKRRSRITSAREREKHLLNKHLPTTVHIVYGNVLQGLDFLVSSTHLEGHRYTMVYQYLMIHNLSSSLKRIEALLYIKKIDKIS